MNNQTSRTKQNKKKQKIIYKIQNQNKKMQTEKNLKYHLPMAAARQNFAGQQPLASGRDNEVFCSEECHSCNKTAFTWEEVLDNVEWLLRRLFRLNFVPFASEKLIPSVI